MTPRLTFRLAIENDLDEIVSLLADDALGSKREQPGSPLPEAYRKAFRIIEKDPHQELIVVEENGDMIGTFQLSFIQYLTYQGGVRAQIEAVRVKSTHRGKGYGRRIFQYAIDRVRKKGAHLLQLTTDKQRPQAIAFYKSLGFVTSHEGMKLHF